MDLVASLKNALDRGYTLEQAKSSLVNSGYGSGEIETAAKYLTGGLGATPQTAAQAVQPTARPPAQEVKQAVTGSPTLPEMPQQPEQTQQMQQLPQMPPATQEQTGRPPRYVPSTTPSQPKKPFPWSILILAIVLLVLLGGLALIIIFRNDIINFFQGL